MGTFSIWHWLIVLVVVLVLFGGRGKIPSLMGDVAKGIKSFKTNMKDENAASSEKIEEAGTTVAREEDETAKS
ncbi:MAG: twin-arginine translocase TatA/TatE family subunit [Alphaproteobacteria bacterium]|jgi:sec-independent protein translocase protein TatA|nr:twin-arginine translocase TatA/TatE family subunit [Alphaproteobacteria bacterium]